MIGTVGIVSAVGQETSQTAAGVIVKNHISDMERDRLMRDAMENARKQLDEQKSDKATDEKNEAAAKVKADKTREATIARQSADRKEEARKTEADRKAASAKKEAADQKAKEVRLAKQLADEEKASSKQAKTDDEKSRSKSTDLDDNDSATRELESIAKAASKDSKKDSGKDSRKTASKSHKTEKKTERSSSDSDDEDSKPDKVVIETVSTKDPRAALSVKTKMPNGDDEREAEQRDARSGSRSSHSNDDDDDDGSDESRSYTGRVVGFMRASQGESRILLNTDERQMVQVVLNDPDEDVPAPGSYISVKGRSIGSGRGGQVISASSLDIKSGRKMEKPKQRKAPSNQRVARPVAPVPMEARPYAVMPPPMPMMRGPMFGPGPMMMPPPPPF